MESIVESGITTFTPAELGGDFSQPPLAALLFPSNRHYNARTRRPDPNVAAFLQANPYFQSNPTLAAQAIIDPTTIDPAAQNYISTFNLMNTATSPTTGDFSPAGKDINNNNELTIKLDFNFSTKDKLSVTLGGYRNPELQPFGLNGADILGFPADVQNNEYFANFAYTRTFSPALLNEFRFTAQRRYMLDALPPTNQTTSQALGFGILSDLPNGPPLMTFDTGLSIGQSPQGPAFLIGDTFAYSDTLTWIKGANTWKFGAGFSAYEQNTKYDYYGNSSYGYAGYNSGGDGTGNSLADFLVGAPNNLFEGANAANDFRSKSLFFFGQDEWRVRKDLVLTLGLRYEYSTPKLDTEARTFSIIPGDQSTRFRYAPLGLVFPGDKGAPRGVNFPDKTNFAPRIGFAWSPGGNSKTSIRGGFGIFYDVLKGEDNLQFNGAPPFYSEPYVFFPCIPTNGAGSCPVNPKTNPAYKTAGTPFYSAPWANSDTPFQGNPFPSQLANPATAFNPCESDGYACPYYNFLPAAGGSVYFVDPHLHTPYTYQYNLSVQQEIANNLIFELNYVGSSSKGLTSLIDANPFDLTTISGPNPARILNEQQTNANLIAFCANQGGPADCPFENASEFGNVSFANFNSMETSLTKQNGNNRIIGNTYFTLAYTWGHSIDNASGFRNRDSQVPYYNPGIFRASSDFDITNRITLSGGWDLPLDRALASAPKRLVNGWSLYPIFSWRNGFPLSINSGLLDSFSPADPGPSGAGDVYLANADFAPGFNHITILNPKTNGGYYFNPAAFVPIPDVYDPSAPYGTTTRDFFRGPGRINLDMALAKTTAISERVHLELRMEAFNVFNHTEFANPTLPPYTTVGGQDFRPNYQHDARNGRNGCANPAHCATRRADNVLDRIWLAQPGRPADGLNAFWVGTVASSTVSRSCGTACGRVPIAIRWPRD